jgi:hypothetical protein
VVRVPGYTTEMCRVSCEVRTEFIYVEESRPTACGLVDRSGGPGLDSWCYQISLVVVSLERGPISLVSTTEELLEEKVVAPV